MEIWLFLFPAVCILVITALLIKLYLMRRSLDELCQNLPEKIKTDTNTLLDISSRDPHLLALADSLNEQLKTLQKERLRFLSGNQQMQERIADISHDLRTPLTAIIGYLDLLEKEEHTKTSDRYLSIIRNRTDVLKELTEELFCYSILTSPSKEMSVERVSLNHVLEESIAAFYLSLKQAGISPLISIPDTPIYRSLNKNGLSRIFGNLLTNAVKYSAGDLSIHLLLSGEILFSNHTTALDSVQLEQLFHRFYTVETAKNSTGLGLSIAKELTLHMGGELQFDYQDSLLTIRIYFPETQQI